MFVIGGYLTMSLGPLIFLIVGAVVTAVVGTYLIISALKKRKDNGSDTKDNSPS